MGGRYRNRATPDGQELGRMMARWCDDAEPAARLKAPELPPRCQSCAFRQGKHTANGSPETQMVALKCVMEGEPFYCHQPDRADHLCSGWAMMRLAHDGPTFTRAPWDFPENAEEEPTP